MKRLLLLIITVLSAFLGIMAECTDPYFKGGDEKLQQWFVKKMKYPQGALVMEKSGCVTFEVTISGKGKVEDYNYELDSSAGSIEIGEDIDLGGLSTEKSIDNGSKRTIEISNGAGSVEIRFH